jgi:putative transposase
MPRVARNSASWRATCFTVETIRRKALYVLFLHPAQHQTGYPRRVTAHPDSVWVTQQARNATMALNDRELSTRFVLRDHDTKFTRGFDDVSHSQGTTGDPNPDPATEGERLC